MRFSWKVFLCTLFVVAAGLSFSGYVLVSTMFDASLRRETRQALDENSLLRFAFEMTASNTTAKYQALSDKTVAQIGGTLSTGNRILRISGESQEPLYTGADFAADDSLLAYATADEAAVRITRLDDVNYVQTAAVVKAVDRTLYLETLKDVSVLFADRDAWFSAFRQVSLVTLFFVALVTYVISLWLTRPVRHLSAVARSMAQGQTHQRARKMSNDEMGQLTEDFNHMANTLEEQINHLKDEARAREDFVAAFAHEIKTPLTAIIGFADMLRSLTLTGEEQCKAAHYIFQEGKRLESLSLRLLDLIVLRHRELKAQSVAVSELFTFVTETYSDRADVTVTYDDGSISADAALLKTVLINLADNGRKASQPGQTVVLTGQCEDGGYRFAVTDQGKGIPADELNRIMEPFYVIDKSRSGNPEGAGLGLSLCAGILELHRSRLEIQSKVGEGTTVSFVLPLAQLGEEI